MKKFAFILGLIAFLFVSTQVQAFSFSGNINKLLNKKKSLKCTYSYKLDEQTLKGTIYTSGKKFRSETVTASENKKIYNYSLSDGKNLYTWSSNNNQGMKINIKESQKLAKKFQNDANSQEYSDVSKELNSQYKFKCQNWKAKSNKFRKPQNIEFGDLSKTMKQIQKSTCGICNQLPSQAKQACLDNCQ